MMHYISTGIGNHTLVLIHGFCENNTCFNKQVLFFKDTCKIIIPDLPGFGQSPLYTSEISLEKMADDLYQLLLKEGSTNVIMLGHSMGGYLTLAFAKKYPKMLLGFGLIHSTARADQEERKLKRTQVIKFVEKEGVEPYIRNFIPTLFQEGANPINIDFALGMGLESSKEGIINAARAMMNRDENLDLLRETHLPVFWAIGKYDQLIPSDDLFHQASLCKIAKVAYLTESAHMSQLEQSEQLNEEIQEFIQLSLDQKERK